MKILKNLLILSFLLFGTYTLVMYFLDNKKVFQSHYKLAYPIEKIFDQFYDLRNFSDWNSYFDTKDEFEHLQYYMPYKGVGSSLKLVNKKDSLKQVELFLRKALVNHSIGYDFFSSKTSDPYRILVRFQKINSENTSVFWRVETPTIPYYKRFMAFFTQDYISNQINQSMQNLKTSMSGKIEKNLDLTQLKTDSIFVEKQQSQCLVGMEESVMNKKGELFKSLVAFETKIHEYAIRVFGKKEDELGYPILIFDDKDQNKATKSIKVFYGRPIFKKETTLDSSFKIRLLEPKKMYSLFFKGNYDARLRSKKSLIAKAEKDSIRYGGFTETFLKTPKTNEESTLKISLQILD